MTEITAKLSTAKAETPNAISASGTQQHADEASADATAPAAANMPARGPGAPPSGEMPGR